MNRLAVSASRWFVILGISSVQLVAAAAPPTTRPHVSQHLETSTYDVRELLDQVRPYTPPTSLIPPTEVGPKSGVSPGLFTAGPEAKSDESRGIVGAPPAATSPERSDALLKLIEETVDPESWRDNGGSIGAIKLFDGQLIVTQTSENHRSIASLLAQMQAVRWRQISVRAHWVQLDNAQLASMTTPAKIGDSGPTRVLMADMAAIEKLDAKSGIHLRAQTTCVEGQTVRDRKSVV